MTRSIQPATAAGGGARATQTQLGSPADAFVPRHQIEMAIAAQQGKRMLPTKGCNPNIIGWNRLALSLQFQSDLGVTMGGRLVNVQDHADAELSREPAFVDSP